MTAAFVHLTGSAMRSRWRGFVTVLTLALPVPLFAALGLSLPLPATVERLAARLVPFGNAEALDSSNSQALASGGTIVLAPGEGRSQGSTASEGSTSPRLAVGADAGHQVAPGDAPRGTSPGSREDSVDPAKAPTTAEHGGAPAPVQSEAPSGGATSPPDQEGPPPPGPGPTPTPTPGVVDTATNTAKEAVTTATDAAAAATGTVTNTTTTAVDTAKGAVAPLLPP
jgi:hypothetical protein